MNNERKNKGSFRIHVEMRGVKLELFIHLNVISEVNRRLSWAGQTQYKHTRHKYQHGWIYSVVRFIFSFLLSFDFFFLLNSWGTKFMKFTSLGR